MTAPASQRSLRNAHPLLVPPKGVVFFGSMTTASTPWIARRAAGTVVLVLVILATGTGGGGGNRVGGVAGAFVVNASPSPATSVSIGGGDGGGGTLTPNDRRKRTGGTSAATTDPASSSAAVVHAPDVTSSSHLRVPVAATRASTSLLAGASSAAVAVPNGGGNGDDGSGGASKATTSEEALASIRFAYRGCFYSAIVDVLSVILSLAQLPNDDEVVGADGGPAGMVGSILTIRHLIAQTRWPDVVDLLSTFNILAFGAGLVRVHRLYKRSVETQTLMDSSSLSDACRTMARLWRQSAYVIVMGSMVLSTSWLGKGSWATAGRTMKWAKRAGPLAVAALVIPGSFTLRKLSAEAATREAAESGKGAKSGMEEARSLGFLAARNMALCMGAFGLLALTKLVVTLTKPGTPPVARVMGLTDVAEDLIIASLIATLNRYYLRAVVTATGEDRQRRGSFANLYGAQRGFYDKMGKTLFIQSTLQILPSLFDMVVKPLIVAAKSTIKP